MATKQEKLTYYGLFTSGLCEFMEQSGLKVKDISQICGMSEQTVYSWTQGRAVPQFECLAILHKAGMTVNQIFGGKNSVEAKEDLEKVKISAGKQEKIEALTKENQELKKQLEAAQKSGIASEKIALALGDIVKRLEALEAVKK